MDARQFVESLQSATSITPNISDKMALVLYLSRDLIYRQELSLSGRNLLFGGCGHVATGLDNPHDSGVLLSCLGPEFHEPGLACPGSRPEAGPRPSSLGISSTEFGVVPYDRRKVGHRSAFRAVNLE
jgi:hypothetical protein